MNATTTGRHAPSWTWSPTPVTISGFLLACCAAVLLCVVLVFAAAGGTTLGPDVRAEPARAPTLGP